MYIYYYKVNACIKSELKGATDVKPLLSSCDAEDITFPECVQVNLRTAELQEFCFSLSEIVSYFVLRSVSDGLPADDFKAINKTAENLFICGHIQCIETVRCDNQLLFKAKCLPQMKKDKVYIVKLGLNSSLFDIMWMFRRQGSCKYIGALSYLLVDYCMFPQYVTCTDIAQEWNIPRCTHVEPISVEKLGCCCQELLYNLQIHEVQDQRCFMTLAQ